MAAAPGPGPGPATLTSLLLARALTAASLRLEARLTAAHDGVQEAVHAVLGAGLWDGGAGGGRERRVRGAVGTAAAAAAGSSQAKSKAKGGGEAIVLFCPSTSPRLGELSTQLALALAAVLPSEPVRVHPSSSAGAAGTAAGGDGDGGEGEAYTVLALLASQDQLPPLLTAWAQHKAAIEREQRARDAAEAEAEALSDEEDEDEDEESGSDEDEDGLDERIPVARWTYATPPDEVLLQARTRPSHTHARGDQAADIDYLSGFYLSHPWHFLAYALPAPLRLSLGWSTRVALEVADRMGWSGYEGRRARRVRAQEREEARRRELELEHEHEEEEGAAERERRRRQRGRSRGPSSAQGPSTSPSSPSQAGSSSAPTRHARSRSRTCTRTRTRSIAHDVVELGMGMIKGLRIGSTSPSLSWASSHAWLPSLSPDRERERERRGRGLRSGAPSLVSQEAGPSSGVGPGQGQGAGAGAGAGGAGVRTPTSYFSSSRKAESDNGQEAEAEDEDEHHAGGGAAPPRWAFHWAGRLNFQLSTPWWSTLNARRRASALSPTALRRDGDPAGRRRGRGRGRRMTRADTKKEREKTRVRFPRARIGSVIPILLDTDPAGAGAKDEGKARDKAKWTRVQASVQAYCDAHRLRCRSLLLLPAELDPEHESSTTARPGPDALSATLRARDVAEKGRGKGKGREMASPLAGSEGTADALELAKALLPQLRRDGGRIIALELPEAQGMLALGSSSPAPGSSVTTATATAGGVAKSKRAKAGQRVAERELRYVDAVAAQRRVAALWDELEYVVRAVNTPGPSSPSSGPSQAPPPLPDRRRHHPTREGMLDRASWLSSATSWAQLQAAQAVDFPSSSRSRSRSSRASSFSSPFASARALLRRVSSLAKMVYGATADRLARGPVRRARGAARTWAGLVLGAWEAGTRVRRGGVGLCRLRVAALPPISSSSSAVAQASSSMPSTSTSTSLPPNPPSPLAHLYPDPSQPWPPTPLRALLALYLRARVHAVPASRQMVYYLAANALAAGVAAGTNGASNIPGARAKERAKKRERREGRERAKERRLRGLGLEAGLEGPVTPGEVGTTATAATAATATSTSEPSSTSAGDRHRQGQPSQGGDAPSGEAGAPAPAPAPAPVPATESPPSATAPTAGSVQATTVALGAPPGRDGPESGAEPEPTPGQECQLPPTSEAEAEPMQARAGEEGEPGQGQEPEKQPEQGQPPSHPITPPPPLPPLPTPPPTTTTTTTPPAPPTPLSSTPLLVLPIRTALGAAWPTCPSGSRARSGLPQGYGRADGRGDEKERVRGRGRVDVGAADGGGRGRGSYLGLGPRLEVLLPGFVKGVLGWAWYEAVALLG